MANYASFLPRYIHALNNSLDLYSSLQLRKQRHTCTCMTTRTQEGLKVQVMYNCMCCTHENLRVMRDESLVIVVYGSAK